MNWANFGIGVGNLASGLERGMNTGRKIRDVRDENQIRNVYQEGLNAAEQTRSGQIDQNVRKLDPTGRGDTPTAYRANDRTFRNEADARREASAGADDTIEIFMRDTAPRIAETYISQGNIEKAQQWQAYLENDKSKRAIKDWSQSYMAAKNGDWDKAAEGFGRYYTDYVEDNIDYKGHELVQSEDGTVTGFNITLKDNDTGRTTTVPMSTDDLVSMGAAQNPQALFEMAFQQEQQANQARLASAQSRAEDDREFVQDVQLSDIQHRQNLERDTHQAGLDRAGGGSDKPADVRTAEWLMSNGVAKTPDEAWQLTNMATTTSRNDFALEYAKMLTSSQDQFAADKVDSQAAIQQGLQVYDQIISSQRNAATPTGRPEQNGIGGVWSDIMTRSQPRIAQ